MHGSGQRRQHALAALGRLAVLFVSSLLRHDAAIAGAWTFPQGTGQVITSGDWISNNPSLFGRSLNPNTQRSIKREARLYAEYGVTDWLTAVFQPEGLGEHLAAPSQASYKGLGYTSFGLRARVLTTERLIVSLESRAALPGPSDRGNLAQAGNTGPQSDWRINAGYAFDLWSWPAFVDVSAGYRVRTGRPPDEYRLDAAIGIHPRPNWLLFLQSFNMISARAGTGGFPEQRSSKIEASIVYDWSQRWSVQVGALQTVASRRAGFETGVIGAVWYRF